MRHLSHACTDPTDHDHDGDLLLIAADDMTQAAEQARRYGNADLADALTRYAGDLAARRKGTDA